VAQDSPTLNLSFAHRA